MRSLQSFHEKVPSRWELVARLRELPSTVLGSQRLFLQVPLLLLPLLLGCVLAFHFHDPSHSLYANIHFKLVITASSLATFVLYIVGAWACRPANDDGADVALGTDGKCQRLYYCGRSLPIPDTDGVCGPNNGPQCLACIKFQEKMVGMPFLPYMFALHPALKLAQWAIPCVCMGLFFAFWVAPEQDLRCGPEAWGSMIPAIGDLYLPSPGSSADKRVLGELLDLSLFNPVFHPPSLLLPTMNHPIPPLSRFLRTEYFVSDMFFATTLALMILEGVRWVSKNYGKKEEQGNTIPLGHAFTAPLLGASNRNIDDSPRMHHSELLEGLATPPKQRMYFAAFAVWYVGYQVVLYMLMDYGTSHGLMNLTTGIAWELWVPFIEFILLTALVTGIVRYATEVGAAHDHPAPMVLMQLTPWLGNELHIMKDHIATALCFAAAHCSDGSLRLVGLSLGYLSIIATVAPLIPLISNSKSFQALRSSHWPIMEASLLQHAPNVKEDYEKDHRHISSGLFARCCGELLKNKAMMKKMVETGISATGHDKYIRALVGEVPHATLHVIFAFFFGGGVFIVTAILMSAVKILCIPVGRTYLRRAIPTFGCTEASVMRFLTSAGGRLEWSKMGMDPVEAAYKRGWYQVLSELRQYYGDLDKDYASVSGLEVEQAPQPRVAASTSDCTSSMPSDMAWVGVGVSVAAHAAGASVTSVPSVKEEQKEVKEDGLSAGIVGYNLEIDEEEEDCESSARLRAIINKVMREDLKSYMAMLATLKTRLGWVDDTEASYMLAAVCSGQVSEEALDHLKTIVGMGAKPPTEQILEDIAEGVDEELRKKVVKAVTGVVDGGGKKSSAKSVEDVFDDDDEENPDFDETLRSKIEAERKVHERQVAVACFSVAIGFPLLFGVALSLL